MHTHLKGLHPRGQRHSHNGFRANRHPNHTELRLSLHAPSREVDAEGGGDPAARRERALHSLAHQAATCFFSGGSGGEGKRHSPPQTLPAQPTTQCFPDCFFSSPQLKESFDFIGLVAHPCELNRIEPAVGQTTDVKGPPLLEVDAERALMARRNNHQLVSVADAHSQRIDVRPTGLVVTQHRCGVASRRELLGEQRAGELEQEFVGCRAGIAAGRCQPDVRGFQIGARTLNHRKKVSR